MFQMYFLFKQQPERKQFVTEILFKFCVLDLRTSRYWSASVEDSRVVSVLPQDHYSRGNCWLPDYYSPLNGTVVVRVVVSRGQQSHESTVGIAGYHRDRH